MKNKVLLFTASLLAVPEAFATEAGYQKVAVISSTEFYKMLGSLAAVIVLILALAWLARYLNGMKGKGNSGLYRVLASQMIGARERIMLIEVSGRYLLIALSSGNINTLCDFGETRPAGFEAREAGAFKKIIKNAMSRETNG